MSEIKSNDTMNYRSDKVIGSQYSFYDVFPQNQSSNFTLQLNTVTNCIFELTPQVWNLSRSYLSFQVQLPAPGAGPNIWSRVLVGRPPIRAISLRTKSGLSLVRIDNHFPLFWKMVVPQTTSMEEYLNQGPLGGLQGTAAQADEETMCTFHQPAGKDVAVAVANQDSGIQPTHDNNVNISLKIGNGLAPEQLLSGGDSATVFFNCRLHLGRIAHTFFAIDKNCFSGDQLQLSIDFSPVTDIVSTTTDVSANNGLATFAVAGSQLNDVRLQLATEQNPLLVKAVMDRWNSQGLKINFPYSHFQRNVLTQGENSRTYRLTPGLGKRWLRSLFVVSSAQESNLSVGSAYNKGAPLCTSYYCTVDNQRETQSDLNYSDGTAWNHNKRLFSGSAVAGMHSWLAYCPVHVSEHTSVGSLTETKEADKDEDGIDLLDKEYSYGVNVNTPVANSNLNVVHVTLREATFSPGQVTMI